MLELVSRAFGQEAWNEIVSDFQDLSLLHTWEYAEAKARVYRCGVWRAVFVQREGIIGAVQALLRRIPLVGCGVVWINRGPLWRRADGGDPAVLVALP